jgi:signal transduction histidine kinase
MSHELRTPLNAILGFAQLLERSVACTTEDRESLAIIQRSGEHLLRLINDVLSISKIEAGRMVLQEQAFDLLQMLQDLEGMFHSRARAKSVI